MKEKNNHETLLFFYLHSDLLEEIWNDYKRQPNRVQAIHLLDFTLDSFPIYEDVSKMLPNVIGKIKSPENHSENGGEYELKKLKLSIRISAELSAAKERKSQSKLFSKKQSHLNTKYFWELQKEFLSEKNGKMRDLLEENAQNVIRFNNELELQLIEHYGFNYRKKISMDIL
ncbi:hypothetical protein EHO60_01560 [Leptospira fletcheri]|uniref:Uncharacterized protein n=1 Tax=Leptospira fletcheri TaxID=2484981 RepID=A0A4R9GK50_9LEPT|nr:hypothetical protein [Leptospira fletcheri]TGK14057.1 hypothetical protein EHO60_01560 [Leptospira fletcheri]